MTYSSERFNIGLTKTGLVTRTLNSIQEPLRAISGVFCFFTPFQDTVFEPDASDLTGKLSEEKQAKCGVVLNCLGRTKKGTGIYLSIKDSIPNPIKAWEPWASRAVPLE